MDHESYPDDYLRGILESVRTIAVVGDVYRFFELANGQIDARLSP